MKDNKKYKHILYTCPHCLGLVSHEYNRCVLKTIVKDTEACYNAWETVPKLDERSGGMPFGMLEFGIAISSENRLKILSALMDKRQLTKGEVHDMTGIDSKLVKDNMDILSDEGIIKRISADWDEVDDDGDFANHKFEIYEVHRRLLEAVFRILVGSMMGDEDGKGKDG